MAALLSRELRAKSDDELEELFEDKKADLYTLRINLVSGELKDTSAIKSTRREIARIQTILRERELAAAIAEEEIS